MRGGGYLRLRADGALGLGVLASLAFVGAFVILPTLEILERSAGVESRPYWSTLLGTSQTVQVVSNTITLGCIVGAVGTAIGLALALVQVRTNFRFKRLVHVITVVPIIAPPFSVAMSVSTLFGQQGLISSRVLGLNYDINGLDGLIISTSISFMPIAYLNFIGMLRTFDPGVEDAAADLGAGLLVRLRTVLLPLLAPGIASSVLLVFVSAISDLGNPILLGGDYDVLSARIYRAVTGEANLDKASVLSVLLLAPSLGVFGAQYVWLRKKQYVTITGRPTGRLRPIVARGFTWPLYAMAAAMIVLVVVVYGYIVVGALTEVWNVQFGFTLDHVRFVIGGAGREALFDTVRLALLATPISGVIGLVIAYLIARRQNPTQRLLDFASVLGIAMPGTMIGLGLLMVYNRPHFGLIPELNGTATIVVVAFAVRSVPGVVRVTISALSQLSDNLEEASMSLGARPTQTFYRVVLPLIRPAVLASLIWSFARSMTTLAPIVFLVSPEWRIMTAQILSEAEQGRSGVAAAYSLVVVVVVMVAIGLMTATSGVRYDSGKIELVRGDRRVATR